MSITEIYNGTANNLFPSVSQDALALNSIDYVCLFLHNTDSRLTIVDLQVWLGTASNSNFSIAVAVDDVGATLATSHTLQSTIILTRYIAPSDVGYFSFPENQSEALSLPDLAPNYCSAVWLQRTLLYSDPINSENITIFVSGATD